MITLIGYNTNLRGYLIVVKNKHCNIKTHILNIWTLFVVQIDPLLSLNLIFWLECLCQLQVLLWLSLFLLVLVELSLGSGSVTRDSLLCSELSPLPLSDGGSGPHLPSPAIARPPDPSSQSWGLSCCWMSSWQLSCIFVAVYSHHFQLGIIMSKLRKACLFPATFFQPYSDRPSGTLETVGFSHRPSIYCLFSGSVGIILATFPRICMIISAVLVGLLSMPASTEGNSSGCFPIDSLGIPIFK